MMSLDKLSAIENPSDEELLKLISSQFQILFAFRIVNISKHESMFKILTELMATDPLVGGHMAAMECLLPNS
jgi:hypothetical protein